ncbi:hypothetical protein G5S56_20025 [Shigella boydii]|uniref:Uncharacterized protein n=1 Tax=Shigella boydii TaxID=621 RepID=A0A7G6K7J4_SHIBO|nr:hypothetical protein [Shigella boydii]QNC63187.1 hypothetical protein G5S56_20025 [Shigella boydii]WNT65058.1 hypothetical protein PWR52_04080 [Shigella boydii]
MGLRKHTGDDKCKTALMRYAYQAYKDARSSKRDKAFTPHPAWKTRTLLSIWGQHMLA